MCYNNMTDKQIDQIKKILNAGNRVEIIPVKNGVRIYQIKRREIK